MGIVQKHQLLILILILMIMLLWLPIAYTGLARTSVLSVHLVNMIDAGIVANQPWTDPTGAVHPFKEFGFANLQWNQSNISPGYKVESYNFTNISNVTAIEWDFQALIAKSDNGRPVYEGLAPPYQTVYPFNGLDFRATLISLKAFFASWDNRNITLNVPSTSTNVQQNIMHWPDADYKLRSQISVSEIGTVIQMLPSTQTVSVIFSTSWNITATLFATEAGLSNYSLAFQRAASLLVTFRNGTALSAIGAFSVAARDTPPVSLTYRLISLPITLYVTTAIAAGSGITLWITFKPLHRGRHSEPDSLLGRQS